MKDEYGHAVHPIVQGLFILGVAVLFCLGVYEFWTFTGNQEAAWKAKAENEKRFEEFVQKDPSRFQTLKEARKAFNETEQKAVYKAYVKEI